MCIRDRLDTALKKYKIEIPFPQRDLNVRSLFGMTGSDAIAALRGERILPAEAGGMAHPALELSEEERAALSRNDARADTCLLYTSRCV